MAQPKPFQTKIGSWVDAATEEEENLVASQLTTQIAGITVDGNGPRLITVQTPPGGTADAPNARTGAGNTEENVEQASVVSDEISAGERSLLQKIIRRGLVDTGSKLEIKQKDPTSPLYSATSFEDLNLRPELLKGVYAMGFNAPSRIQESALPILLADPPQNIIAQSQSGTGKTAAFVLAMLSRVDTTKNYPQILCLSPTYELALQTGDIIKQMGKFCPEITVVFAVRGVDIPTGEKLTQHIVIGTPGKVTDWAFRHNFFSLAKICVFVLDEADVMIATQGYQDTSIKIQRKLPKNCQFMLFSATYEAEVMEFAEKIVPDATVMRLKREEESLDNIKQYYIDCKNQNEKYRAIANIYGVITVGQAMIFCQTRRTASWLVTKLVQDGHSVALLTGELTVEQRIAVLNRFRDGRERILITTNVMARGIDVEQVTLVVNFDLPVDVKSSARL